MPKLKGIKVVRNKRGKARQLIVDIEKNYDVVENLVDVLESEKRLHEKGKPADEVFKELELLHTKKKSGK